MGTTASATTMTYAVHWPGLIIFVILMLLSIAWFIYYAYSNKIYSIRMWILGVIGSVFAAYIIACILAGLMTLGNLIGIL